MIHWNQMRWKSFDELVEEQNDQDEGKLIRIESHKERTKAILLKTQVN